MTKICAFFLAAAASTLVTPAQANPVVYTVQTVLDGSLGSMVLNESLVRFKFTGDTSDVHTEISNGVPVSAIHKGTATISVLRGGQWVTATFTRDQVYVRYDVA